MASLERRIKVLEITERTVVPPRISVMFLSPSRSTVGARLWRGGIFERTEDETEEHFLRRARHIKATHD